MEFCKTKVGKTKVAHKKIALLSIMGIACLHAELSLAGVSVVVHPSVELASIQNQIAANIFLGKSSLLPDGTKVIPIDQEEGEEPRDEFYQKVVKKDASQLNAYWSRLIFTGKGQPPKVVLDDDEVIELIAANPNLIGYVSDSAVDSTVKVILSVP